MSTYVVNTTSTSSTSKITCIQIENLVADGRIYRYVHGFKTSSSDTEYNYLSPKYALFATGSPPETVHTISDILYLLKFNSGLWCSTDGDVEFIRSLSEFHTEFKLGDIVYCSDYEDKNRDNKYIIREFRFSTSMMGIVIPTVTLGLDTGLKPEPYAHIRASPQQLVHIDQNYAQSLTSLPTSKVLEDWFNLKRDTDSQPNKI